MYAFEHGCHPRLPPMAATCQVSNWNAKFEPYNFDKFVPITQYILPSLAKYSSMCQVWARRKVGSRAATFYYLAKTSDVL